MPAHHKVYPDFNLVVATMEGRLTVPEILADNLLFDSDLRNQTIQHALLDTSAVSEFRVTFGGLVAMAKHFLGLMEPTNPTILTAIYAPSDLMFSKGQTYQRLSSSSEANCIGVFRTLPECWAFLGIETDTLSEDLRNIGLTPST